MALRLAVDAERLVGDYLRGRSEITTLAPGGVMTELTSLQTFPGLVFHRGGGTNRHREHLDGPFIQVEAWAEVGQRKAAHDLIAAARAAMNNDPGNIVKTHTLGVVTGTSEVTGPQWLPDVPTGRARFLFITQVFVHP